MIKQKLIIRDDFTVDTQASWKFASNGFSWDHDNPPTGASQWFVDLFKVSSTRQELSGNQ